MTSKSNKYALLDKNENQYPDMIEMVDMTGYEKGVTQDKSQKDNVDYVRLDDQDLKVQQTTKKIQKTQPQKKPQPQAPSNQKKPNQVQQSQAPCMYPTHSQNPNPTRIQMNGSNYQMQNASPKKVSKFPEMEVACNFCTFKQSVPGNTQLYVCCCCNNMNQCYPLYGLFICGYCQSKVCYPYGTSDMIKCTRCGTVNRVPFQPPKTYTKQMPKQEKKQLNKKEKKFVEEDEIILEHEEEPQRPKQKVKKMQEEELFFDDFEFESEKPKKQKQQNYPDIL